MKKRKQHIECCYLFALIWTVGATSNEQADFSEFLLSILRNIEVIEEEHPGVMTALLVRKWEKPTFGQEEILGDGSLLCPLPETGIVHDYLYSPSEANWLSWTSTLGKYEIPDKASYDSITVPTAATAKMSFLLVSTRLALGPMAGSCVSSRSSVH